MESTPNLTEALGRLEQWIEGEDYRGWDPYDALRSPILRRLAFGSRPLGIFWIQLMKRSPVNLRPLLLVPKEHNPKAMGLFLSSYLRRAWTTNEPDGAAQANYFAEWLRDNASTEWAGPCWGCNFDWPNRGSFAPAGTPTVVNTAFNALALLETGDVLTARAACDFVLHDLHRCRGWGDEICFSYTPDDRRFVHNANVLAAQLLAQVGAMTGEAELTDTALMAARFTVRRQAGDGSWRYGPGPTDAGIDNFHTGFVLVALHRIGKALGTGEFDKAVASGLRFWKDRFFLESGAPKYYPHKLHPIDAHAVAQAVLTWLELRGDTEMGVRKARRVADWGIQNMQNPQGWFDFQIHRHHRIRIPYMRWSQAWMQRALRELAWVEAGRPRPSSGLAPAGAAHPPRTLPGHRPERTPPDLADCEDKGYNIVS